MTILATDGRSEPVITTFNVTVLDRDALNQQPIAITITDRIYVVNANTDYIPVSALFTDADGDILSYVISITNTDLITVTEDGNTFAITPVAVGETTVTISATDGKSYPVSITFTLTIEDITSSIIETGNDIEVNIYQNPVVDYATVAYKLTTEGKVSIRLFDINGKVVLSDHTTNTNSYILKTQNLTSGVYMLSIQQNGKQVALKKVIKK